MLDLATIGIALETKSLEKGVVALQKVEKAADKTADSADKLSDRFVVTEKSVNKTADSTDKLSDRLTANERTTKSVTATTSKFTSVLVGLASIGTALAIVKMADSVSTLNSQLRLATGSTSQATRAYDALFEIAQKGRVSFTELGTTYSAIARAGNEMGVSQTRLLAVTQSISQAMTIGGGSAQSMQAALVQLGQGLSSGTLRGEELNSIMEQTPRLAKAIADGLGVPIGELRKLGEAGLLTGQQVISALEKSGPQLAREMENATLTVGQAFTLLSNSTVRFIGEADKASNATGTLAGAMQGLSKAIDAAGNFIQEHQTAFLFIGGGLASAATVAGVYALGAGFVALAASINLAGLALLASPIGLAVSALAAIGGGLYLASENAKRGAQGLGFQLDGINEEIKKIETTQEGNTAAGMKRLERLQAKRAEVQGKLAAINSGGLDTRAEDARFQRSTSAMKERQKITKDYMSLQQELSGVSKDFQTNLSKLKAGFDAGIVDQAKYVEDVKALIAKEGGIRKAGTNQIEKDRLQTIKQADDFIQKLKEEIQSVGLSKNQIKMLQASRAADNAGTPAQAKEIRQLALARDIATKAEEKSLDAAKDTEEAMQRILKSAEDRSDARIKFMNAEIAAQGELNNLRTQSARELAGIGQGTQRRERNAGLAQIEDRFSGQRQRLRIDLRDAPADQYQKELDLIRRTEAESVSIFTRTFDLRIVKQKEWVLGATEALNNYATQTANVMDQTENLVTKSFKGMEDALVSFAKTGKLDFKSLANSIIADMVRMTVQQSITGPLANMALSLFTGGALTKNANGGVFNSPSLSAYSGGVYDTPQPFAFAKGAGVFGEAGPEAIMPLKRGPDGNLGVQASGGSGPAVTNNIVINATVGDVASKSDVVQGMQIVKGQMLQQLSRQQNYGGAMA